jgi:hypothetical protein
MPNVKLNRTTQVKLSFGHTERQVGEHGVVSPSGRRWYLRDDLRALLRAKVDRETGGEGYDVVAKRVGISGPALHDLLSGKTASSFAVPALCKLYGIDPLEYLPLDDEQLEWLRILEELKASGRDPKTVLKSFRDLALPPPAPSVAPPTADPPPPEKPSRGRPGRVRTRGTRE